MVFGEEKKRIAVFLSRMGKLYTDTYLTSERNYAQFNDAFEALLHFSTGYAFERNGAPPLFRQIAEQALVQTFAGKLQQITDQDTKSCWTTCLKLAGRRKLNKNLYPLNPARSAGGNQGLLNLMLDKRIINLADWTTIFLRKNKAKEVHGILTGVRGIGRKIASFYLRDIAWLQKISESGFTNQGYLQPIDLWVNRALEYGVGKRKGINYDTPDHSYWNKTDLIIELCDDAGCSPIEFNMGSWMLGARVSNGKQDFRKILRDSSHRILKQRFQTLQEKASEARLIAERSSKMASSLEYIYNSLF